MAHKGETHFRAMEDIDEATPRGIIRGVLTTENVSQSVRALKSKKTPRTQNVRETPTDPPSHTSHSQVASRLLTRSSRNRKRKTVPGTTPSDSATPRTLIAGFLQTAPVTRSVVKGQRQKTVEQDTKRSSRLSVQAGDNTPRTIIQNFLREVLTETPVEPVLPESSDAVDQEKSLQSSEQEKLSSLATSGVVDDQMTEADDLMFASTSSHSADNTTHVEATALMVLDSYIEMDNATGIGSTQGTQREVDSLLSLGSLQEDTERTGNGMQTSRPWRELVTPQLPFNVSLPGSEKLEHARNVNEGSSKGKRPLFEEKPPKGKEGTKVPKKPTGPRMPPSLIKSVFQHFSQAKVSKEALETVENGSNLFFKQVSSDLMAYCKHAHRSTIELADVELLMKRQGFITDKQSLYSLVEKYLPLEYRQEIIPTVQAGNKIIP